MNRWAEANIETNPDWKVMLEGNPLSSSYLWVAFLITATAFIAMAKAVSRIYGNHQEIMQWAPILLGVLVLMGMTAERAVRAIRDARLETAAGKCGGAAARQAFQKFRAYSIFTVVAAVGMGLLGLCL
jgi:hypothetical protein